MPGKDWDRAFDDPIPPPDGGELRTLRDVATYITKLWLITRRRNGGMLSKR
jgi:hypothetical protein